MRVPARLICNAYPIWDEESGDGDRGAKCDVPWGRVGGVGAAQDTHAYRMQKGR